MSDYDSPWKEALEVYFEPFMAFFFPEAHADIDWSRGYESLDKELQKIVREGEVGRRIVDKLFKVWLKDGREHWVLIHVEVQLDEEAAFRRRMYQYNYRAFDRYNVEVVSIAVLGDDNPNWRPSGFRYARWGFHAEIGFPVVKLLDYADREEWLERHPNPFAMVVLAHLKTRETRHNQGGRLAWKTRLTKGLYDRGMKADDVRKLFRFIDWLMDLPKELERSFWDDVKQYEEVKHMPFITTPERIGREEGLAQGLAKGRAEGAAQGRTEGIQALLELKFGDAGLQLMPEIREIHDADRLETILKSIKSAATPGELRRLWTE